MGSRLEAALRQELAAGRALKVQERLEKVLGCLRGPVWA
jgi:hypothetical protein